MNEFENSFHNTIAMSKYSHDDFEHALLVQNTQSETHEDRKIIRAAKRLKKKLCGYSSCCCSNEFGYRSN